MVSRTLPRAAAWGIIVPDTQSPFFSGIATGIQHRAHTGGFALLVETPTRTLRAETDLVHQMAPHVNGIVLCSPRMSDHALAALPQTPRSSWSTVSPSTSARSRSTTRTASGKPSGTCTPSSTGACPMPAGLGARGQTADAAGAWSRPPTSCPMSRSSSSAGSRLLSGRVAPADLMAASGATAVIAYRDVTALGILDRLRTRGTVVPEHVSVVGFDAIPAVTHVSPGLRTVAVPLQLLGRCAVDLLPHPAGATDPGSEGRVEDLGPPTRRIAVSLVVRASTAPAPDSTTPVDAGATLPTSSATPTQGEAT